MLLSNQVSNFPPEVPVLLKGFPVNPVLPSHHFQQSVYQPRKQKPMAILSFGQKNVFLVENSISFKNACCVSKDIISDLETGRLTVLTPCSKMREQVKLRAPSINTEEMIQIRVDQWLQ